jgi:hypothetical protein
MYFNDSFSPEFGVIPRPELKNAPVEVRPEGLSKYPSQGIPLKGEDEEVFVHEMAAEIARILGLKEK